MRVLLLLVSLAVAPASAQSWTPTSSLPDGYNGHALVASNGYLYNVGGLSNTNGALDAQRVFRAQVQADGGLSAWTETTPMPSGVFYHAGVAAQGFVYVLGGYHYDSASGLNVSDGVYVAKQNADGTLGAWTSGPALPARLFYASAAFWKGSIYLTGGWDGQQLSNAVYAAVVRADGTLGAWTAQRALPEGVYTHAAVSDGTLYVLGGAVNGGTQIQNTVWSAAVNPDGTLAPWTMANPLPVPLSNHGAAVASGRVFVLGGWDGTQQRAEVYSATSGGTLGSWAAEPPLPKALEKHGVAVWNGRLYVSGGNDPVQTQAGVYWRTLPAPPRPADTQPPVTTLTLGQPAVNGFISPATPLTLTATDDVGVAATYWAVDSGTVATYSAPFSIAADGAHWLQYYSVDTSGNAEAVRVASAAVDGTAPVSTLSVGAPQAMLGDGSLVVSAATLLSVSAADPVVGGVSSGVSTVTATVDGAAVNAAAPFSLPAVDGPHTVTLQAVDAVGNAEASHSARLIMHRTAPITSLAASATAYAAADGGAPYLGASAALSFSAQDPAAAGVSAGVNRTEYALDGGAVARATCTLVLAEGSHALRFRSVDNVGNTESWQSAAYRVDATAPQTTFTVGIPVMMVNGRAVITPDTPLSLSASDPSSGGVASGVKSTVYSLDGGADTAYSAPFKLAVGSHTISYASVDNAGNAEPRRGIAVMVQADDTTPPVTTLSWLGPLSGSFVSAATAARLTAVDVGVGVAATSWSLDDAAFTAYTATSSFQEGAHWLRYFSADLAGNVETVHVSSISVDGTSPASTLSVGAPQATLADGTLVVSSGTLLSASATDPVSNGVASGVGVFTVTVDGKPVSPAAPFALPAFDGPHSVSLQAVDAVGNAEAAHGQTIAVDQTAPATTMTPTAAAYAAADGGAPWLGAAAALAFSAQDPVVNGVASGLNRTEYALDGAAVAAATATLVLTEGSHTIVYRSVDNVGNAEAWKTASYRVDEAAPQTTFTIGSPVMMLKGQAVVTPDTPLTLTATDTLSGVARTVYSLDGGADQAYAGPFKLPIGAHTISYGSVDNAGNAEPRRSVTVAVQPDDTLPPRTTLTWTGPTSGSFVAGSAAPQLTAVDDLSVAGDGKGVGVASIQWSLDAAPFSVYGGTATLAEGAHWLRYYASDLAGNTETVHVASVSVDGTAPVSTLSVGAPQATLADGTLVVSSGTLLSASATDPVSNGVASGVAALRVTVDGKAVGADVPFALPAVDGPHAVSLQATDAVGNAEAAHFKTVYLDQTPPVTTAAPTVAAVAASDGGAPWLGAAAAVAFTAQDPAVNGLASGVNRTEYALDGAGVLSATATLVLAEGAHTVAFRSVDNVGNAEAWKTASYRVDATAPQTTLALGSPVLSLFGKQLVTPQTPLTLTASDPVSGGVASGVKSIVYSVDGGSDQVYGGAFTLAAGAHTLSYGAVDNAGNAEARQTASLAVGTFLADAVAAAQSITLSGGASINGDARAPQVTTDGKSGISGQVYKTAPVEAVSIASARAYAQAANNDGAIASSLTNGALSLSGKAALTLPAGVYYLTGLTLSGQASLAVSGQAQVFVAGPIQVSGQAALNGSADADTLWLFSDGASVSVTGKGRASFNLYAPQAAAQFSGGGQVAGRLYAQTVSLSGHAAVPSTTALPASSVPPGKGRKPERPEPEEKSEATAASLGGASRAVASSLLAAAPPAPVALGAAQSVVPSQRAQDLPAAKPSPKGVSQSSQTYAAAEAFRPARPQPAVLPPQAAAKAYRLAWAAPAPASRSAAAAAAPAGDPAKLPAALPVSRVAQSSQTFAAAAVSLARPAPAALASTALAGAATEPAAPAAPSLSRAAASFAAAPAAALGRPTIRRKARPAAAPVVPLAPKAAVSVVDASGSAVRAKSGEGVVVPPGAVASGLSVSVVGAPVASASDSKNQDRARGALGIVPAGEPVQFGPEGTKFSRPVTIELPFDRSLLAAGLPLSSLVVHYWNPTTSVWEPLSSSVDAQAGVVRAQTSHFSLYQVHAGSAAVAGAGPASGPLSISQAYAYPNPARHGAKPVIHVEATGADTVEVTLFDLSGAQLDQGSGSAASGVVELQLDDKNLGSGVYLYVVKAKAAGQGEARRTGRLAVIK